VAMLTPSQADNDRLQMILMRLDQQQGSHACESSDLCARQCSWGLSFMRPSVPACSQPNMSCTSVTWLKATVARFVMLLGAILTRRATLSVLLLN
jgi:hypothetical protein